MIVALIIKMPVETEKKACAKEVVKKQNAQDQLDSIPDNIQVSGLNNEDFDGDTTNKLGTRVEQNAEMSTDRTSDM